MKIIKNNILSLLSLFMTGILLHSCNKDLGNYSYTELNEGSVSNLDKIYIVDEGNVLHIKPEVTYSKDQSPDTSNYAYEWLLLGRTSAVQYKPEILATGKVLNTALSQNTGRYDATFRITDKRTGVWKQYPFQILITNKFYEGWLVLSEIPGNNSRLDMVKYLEKEDTYTVLTNVLDSAGTELKLEGSPTFVAHMFGTHLGIDPDKSPYERIVVGTTKMATFIGTDSFKFHRIDNFENAIRERGVSFAQGAHLQASFQYSSVFWAEGNVYANAMTTPPILRQINKTGNPAKSFKASPYIGFNNQNFILFNEDESEFLRSLSGNNCIKLENGETLFKNKTEKKLLFMKHSSYNGGEYFAILKDKAERVYLARFKLNGQTYFSEIAGTPIADAEHFEVNDDYGYIFYSIGGKLYVYDFSQKLNKEMADYGAKRISLLKTENFGPLTTSSERYKTLNKQLIVSAYEENKLNSSGILDLYTVPPMAGPLVKVNSFSGFGRIASIVYRKRN